MQLDDNAKIWYHVKRKMSSFFEMHGSRQRLLFARQLRQRKCSLCLQGRFIEKLSNTPLSVSSDEWTPQSIGLKKLGCPLFFNPLLGARWILDKTMNGVKCPPFSGTAIFTPACLFRSLYTSSILLEENDDLSLSSMLLVAFQVTMARRGPVKHL